ncbi:MAG: hypothetical protein KDC88_07385 [Ignavibacteriae bacterium]|nr:hypothetical protein [Ignavibacteriota bacterium]MCB9207472.1 hypothetical protein [Ignavibacteriales bacterium]MCB9211338.1 hypothetical protein [Ignavibacteriales bacterium]MCB9218730.1 hypothetical protein [Ignavibacteriales bacterium]MCB9259264.1 hypothetical protein [Ignavibacteriales bacterium]
MADYFDYYQNKKLFNSLNLEIFNIEKLPIGVVVLKVTLPKYKFLDSNQLIKIVDHLINDGNIHLIIDFTETWNLDSGTIKRLMLKINEIVEKGGTTRFLITEDQPIINYSSRIFLSKIQLFLNLNSAIKDYMQH